MEAMPTVEGRLKIESSLRTCLFFTTKALRALVVFFIGITVIFQLINIALNKNVTL